MVCSEMLYLYDFFITDPGYKWLRVPFSSGNSKPLLNKKQPRVDPSVTKKKETSPGRNLFLALKRAAFVARAAPFTPANKVIRNRPVNS